MLLSKDMTISLLNTNYGIKSNIEYKIIVVEIGTYVS